VFSANWHLRPEALEMIMKNVMLAGVVVMMAGSAMAGGLAEPVMEAEVVEAKAASSAGIIIPLLLLVLIAAALASGGGSNTRV
jgi:hypothetical protein